MIDQVTQVTAIALDHRVELVIDHQLQFAIGWAEERATAVAMARSLRAIGVQVIIQSTGLDYMVTVAWHGALVMSNYAYTPAADRAEFLGAS